MNTTTCSTVVGVFDSRDKAEAAITDLHASGFTESQIGLVLRDTRRDISRPADEGTAEDQAEDAGEGALTGAVAGAGIGGLVGLGVMAGVLPVIGPAIFAGTLGMLASNAAGGAAVLGVIGALTGWGLSEEDAKFYEGEIAAGRAVVTVAAGSRCGEARRILRTHGAVSRDPEFVTVNS
jgi:hypothetical protein